MPARDTIPDKARWQVTSRILTSLPVMYDITFREAVGENFDRLEQQIWMHLAREAGVLADSFRLPVTGADDLAKTLEVIFQVFFGPEVSSEKVPLGRERSVLMIRRCPFIIRQMEIGEPSDTLLSRCLAFTIAAVEVLNPEYTSRFVRSMCTGDRTCEFRILRKVEAESEDTTRSC